MTCSGMKLFLFLLLNVTVGVVVGSSGDTLNAVLGLEAFTNNMMEHFDVFEEPRHPREDTREDWISSRQYIKKAFELIGLTVELQCFNTSVQVEYEDDRDIEGCNVIGISNGDTIKDRIVVGAHYDSSGERKSNEPLRNNGVGVSVLIEIARAYEESARWKGYHKNFTTFFVAFDLNTREQFPESKGLPGSEYFLRDWLEPKTNLQRMPIAGAYIIDSISTYNRVENSQIIPADFSVHFPDAYNSIKDSGNTGNFIAAITTADTESVSLVETFSGHYRRERITRPYRLQEMIAKNNEFGSGGTLNMINHQASFHFWTAKPPIPAVLITDTDTNRMLPAGENCDVDCNYIFATPQRMQFIASTYQTLANTLLDKQTTYVGLIAGATSMTVNCVTIVLSAVLTQLIIRW